MVTYKVFTPLAKSVTKDSSISQEIDGEGSGQARFYVIHTYKYQACLALSLYPSLINIQSYKYYYPL